MFRFASSGRCGGIPLGYSPDNDLHKMYYYILAFNFQTELPLSIFSFLVVPDNMLEPLTDPRVLLLV